MAVSPLRVMAVSPLRVFCFSARLFCIFPFIFSFVLTDDAKTYDRSKFFKAATQLHESRKLNLAEPLYRQALNGDFAVSDVPTDCHNNLALLLVATDRPVEASSVWWSGWRTLRTNKDLLLQNYLAVHGGDVSHMPTLMYDETLEDRTMGKLVRAVASGGGTLFHGALLHEYYNMKAHGVSVASQVYPEGVLKILQGYYRNSTLMGAFHFSIGNRRYGARDEYISRFIKHDIEPLASVMANKPLISRAAYLSGYVRGSEIPLHRDRPLCEYTSWLSIAHQPVDQKWPLWIEKIPKKKTETGTLSYELPPDDAVRVDLAPGDFVLYKGLKAHKRDRFKGKYADYVVICFDSKSEPEEQDPFATEASSPDTWYQGSTTRSKNKKSKKSTQVPVDDEL